MQREDEQNSKFRDRKHCNAECARTNPNTRQHLRDSHKEDRLQHPKRCPICNENFYRRESESKAMFEKRETCGKVCAAVNRSKDRDELIKNDGKTCQNPECGKTFYRRKGTETNSKFKRRKACSSECGHAVRIAELGWTPRPNGERIRGKEGSKTKEVSTLPPATPLKRKIPDAPPPPEREPWRPDSWKHFRDCRPQISA